MQKIVVNKCFGGFGLSYEGHIRYAKLKGFKLYPFKWSISDNITLVNEYQLHTSHWLSYSRTPVHSDSTIESVDSFYDHDIKRNDPALIQTVKELGEEANGNCAKLEIVEIPNDIDWTIEEYDGQEWISEVHQTW